MHLPILFSDLISGSSKLPTCLVIGEMELFTPIISSDQRNVLIGPSFVFNCDLRAFNLLEKTFLFTDVSLDSSHS